MHYWRFLIPVLAVIGAVASFSERPLIDVRQQCFERRERDSSLRGSPSTRSERLITTTAAAESLIRSCERDINQRYRVDHTRELLDNRRNNIVKHERFDASSRLDSRVALGDRRLSSDLVTERFARITSAPRNIRNIERNGEDRFRSSTRRIDSQRRTDERRMKRDLASINSARNVLLSESTRSLERLLSRSNRDADTTQRRTRTLSESSERLSELRSTLGARRLFNDRVSKKALRTALLSRNTRSIARNSEDRAELPSLVVKSRLTPDERRASQEREREISAKTVLQFQNTRDRLHLRLSRGEETSRRRIGTVRSNAFEGSVRNPSRNSEDKSDSSSHLVDSRRFDEGRLSADRTSERSPKINTLFSGNSRSIEERTRTPSRRFETRTLDNRRISRVRASEEPAGTVRFPPTDREIIQQRTRSADRTEGAIARRTREEETRYRSKSLNERELTARRFQNTRNTRSEIERDNIYRTSESRFDRNRARDISENSKYYNEVAARNEQMRSLHRQERLIRERKTERTADSRERIQVNQQNQLLTRDQSGRHSIRFNAQLRRVETQRHPMNLAIERPDARRETRAEDRITIVRDSSLLENRAESHSRLARDSRSSLKSELNRDRNTRMNARVQATLRIERTLDAEPSRTERREAFERVAVRERHTRNTRQNNFSTARNSNFRREAPQDSDFLREMSRRESTRSLKRSTEVDTRTEIDGINGALTTLSPIKSRTKERLSPKHNFRYRRESTKSEQREYKAVNTTPVNKISTKTSQNISGKDIIHTTEWKTLAFHALQGIYVCAIVFQIIGGKNIKGNKSIFGEWMSSPRHSLKVD